MGTSIQFTWAKAHLSALFDTIGQGRGLRVVHRHKSRPIALVDAGELEAVLAKTHPFTCELSRAEDGTVSVWLEQLALYGRGSTIVDAVEDLLDETEQYVDEWEARLRHAPDHEARAWWVRRIQLAPDRDALRELMFSPPDGQPQASRGIGDGAGLPRIPAGNAVGS